MQEEMSQGSAVYASRCPRLAQGSNALLHKHIKIKEIILLSMHRRQLNFVFFRRAQGWVSAMPLEQSRVQCLA